MRAAILREYGEPLAVRDVPAPEPGPDEAVIRVEACGVCRSDWHAWMGHGEWADDRVPRGQVLGHEPAGEVVAVGRAVDRFAPGDRVVVPFSLGDGTCPYCRRVRRTLDRMALDYTTRTVPFAHAGRTTVREVSGQTGVPVLTDPNTDVAGMAESADIVAYLERTYG